MEADISILTVNYNTPGLLRDLLESIEKFMPGIKVFVIDGSEDKDAMQQVKILCGNKKNINLFSLGKNIHHGPGLDFGIRKISSRYILLLDTDSIIIKAGLTEKMLDDLDNGYGIGSIEYVDKNGWNVSGNNGIPYLHPRCALIDKQQYFAYKPALKHGAPMIEAMTDIFNHGEANKLKQVTNLNDYYVHLGRGTVNLTGGYHLEKNKTSFKSRIKKLIKKINPFR